VAFGDTTANFSSTPPLITATYRDAIIRLDSTPGGFDITLDAAVNFGPGVVAIKKINGGNLIRVGSIVPGELEYGRPFLELSLETDSLLMSSDGVGNWTSIGQGLTALRHGFFVAEHDVTALVYNILPSYCGYLMVCDPQTAGGWIQINLPPMVQASFGHHCYVVGVMNFNPGTPPGPTYGVSVVGQPNEQIIDPRAVKANPTTWKVDLPPGAPQRCYTFWTDKARWVIPTSNGI
jgi:hypothetical protein